MVRTTVLDSGWEFAQAEWLEEQPFGYSRVPGWLRATVPGCVHLDLVANGIIRHPFEEMAEIGCQWIDQRDWCYRTRFDAPEGPSGRRVLHFEGLDTICTVFLNGKEIASHDNMFLPLEVDVSDRLFEGENELRIDFQSAVRVGRERRKAYFEKNGIADDVLNFEERAFVRKAQYMFGWDWGPRLVSCGIWKPVRLIESTSGDSTQSSRRAHRDAEELAEFGVHRLVRDADAFGEKFQFTVNGNPIWARGANWIPVHSFPSESQKLRSLLESCAAMNFNMLRVWGGGLYESDEFYDICDELGILVWQDFPFACSYYPDDDDFVGKIREEATYHVKRLRHHPCLALWCGNNEILTMWEGKWGGDDKQPARFHGERIWNEVLKAVVEEHDPGRSYIPTSPIGSPPGKQDSNAGGYGDSHYWDVWHGRGDWVHYVDSTARFSSEFGFPSSCGMRAWDRVFDSPSHQLTDSPPHPITPSSPSARWHDKTGRPWSYWLDLITKHYPEPKDLEELVYYSQLNQRDAMRCAIEHYRRSEFCKGTLIWQLNDCWPVQSWSLIDSEGDWKAAAYEMQRLYGSDLVSYRRVGNHVELWWINDSDEPLEVESYDLVSIFDSMTGEEVFQAPIPKHRLEPGERKVVFEFEVHNLDPTRSILYTNSSYDPIRLLCEPKDLKLAKPKIRARIEAEGMLEVAPDLPVVDLYIWDPTGGAQFVAKPDHWPRSNFLSFETHSPWSYGFTGTIGKVMGRSLAGVHEIEIVDEPVWPWKS